MSEDTLSVTTIQCPDCGMELPLDTHTCPNDGTRLCTGPDEAYVLAGKYEIVSRIASGGMGVVYKAKQLGLNRIVAVKVLATSQLNDVAVRRFQQEAQALATMRHDNLITVHDVGVTSNGQPFMSMDYLEGTDLCDMLSNEGPVPLEKSLNIIQQICDGLSYVHARGILHRDLKPPNIFLLNASSDNPTVKLLDFGIAKFSDRGPGERLTQTGEIFGSPLYMSPEQTRGTALDARSDIYSLGCVMYEMLTGIPPFTGNTFAEILLKQVTEEAPPLSAMFKFPAELDTIVRKSLAKQPADRYQSVKTLAEALKSFATRDMSGYQRPARAQAPVTERPSVTVTQTERNWLAPTLLAIALMSVGIVSIALWLTIKDNTTSRSTPTVTSGSARSALEPDHHPASKAQETIKTAIRNQLLDGDSVDLNEVSARTANLDSNDFAILTHRKKRYLTWFAVPGTPFNDADTRHLLRFPLRYLDLSRTRITWKSIEMIGSLKLLETLNLGGTDIHFANFSLLAGLEDLAEFRAPDTNLADIDVHELLRAHQLRLLQLDNNSGLTDRTVTNIIETQQPLMTLSLSGLPRLDSIGIRSIANIKTLRELDLCDTHIIDQDLPDLSKLPKLTILRIDGAKSITDAGLKNLVSQSLRILSIRNCKSISADGIRSLRKNCPNCAVDYDPKPPTNP